MDEEKFLAFQIVSRNETITVGLEHGVVSAIFSKMHVKGQTNLELQVGGLNTQNDESVKWLDRSLELGEVIKVKVVKVNPAEISSWRRSYHCEPTEEDLLKSFRKLERELKEEGLVE